MGILSVTGCLIAGLFQVSLSSQPLLKVTGVQYRSLISSRPSALPLESTELFDPPLGELLETRCRHSPTGVGIPAFQPGINKDDVLRLLGTPTGTARGYWPNTRAVFYELIPDQVSLGFLFDRNSERIRQTEASFTPRVDSETVLLTLKGMLGCQINDQIQEGLEQVWQRESQKFSFRLNYLKGVIERQNSGRIYIGIWEADLH